MPDRLVQVTVVNNSSFPVVWVDDGKKWGEWQDPWYPSKLGTLAPGTQGAFRMESDGVWTGVEGWAYFRVDVPYANNIGTRTEFFTLAWDRPYWTFEPFDPSIEQARANATLPHAVEVRTRGIGPMGEGDPITDVVLGIFNPLTLIPAFASDALHNHIWWTVEVVDTTVGRAIRQRLESSNRAQQEFVTHIDATQGNVWKALIRPVVTVKYWYEARIESPWTVGAKVNFFHKKSQHPYASGTVLEYSPPHRLAYTFKSEPCRDCKESRITFTLEPDAGKMKLTVRHDQLPETRGFRNVQEAWTTILSSLKSMLEAGRRKRRKKRSPRPRRRR